MSNIIDQLSLKIWGTERSSLSFIKRISLLFIRIIYLIIKKSRDHQIFLRASALTLFSLLAIVPVLASLFGIAKGFGLAEVVESQIRRVFYAQEQVMDLLLAFSERSLEHAKGGVIAGVGIFLLIFTVVRMIGNVESAFNTIWDTDKARTLIRKFTDYIFILILTPFLLVFSSSASLSFLTEVDALLTKMGMPPEIAATVELVAQVVPQILLGLSFGFVYSFLPNTAVRIIPALLGGLVTAVMFIFAQSAYIELQVALTSYGVIYGSFAALPLFIIWLQVAWILVLLGAEITRAIEIRDDYEFGNGKDELSIKKLLESAARIGEALKKSIEGKEGGLNTHQLSKASGLSKRATLYTCTSLKKAKIITIDKENKWIPLIPTQDLDGAKITEIFCARGISF
jgi:membrane protein